MAVSTVKPAPQPGSRFLTPNSIPVRTIGGGPLVDAQHLQHTQDGLGHDQGEALFETLLQAAQVVADPIGL